MKSPISTATEQKKCRGRRCMERHRRTSGTYPKSARPLPVRHGEQAATTVAVPATTAHALVGAVGRPPLPGAAELLALPCARRAKVALAAHLRLAFRQDPNIVVALAALLSIMPPVALLALAVGKAVDAVLAVTVDGAPWTGVLALVGAEAAVLQSLLQAETAHPARRE